MAHRPTSTPRGGPSRTRVALSFLGGSRAAGATAITQIAPSPALIGLVPALRQRNVTDGHETPVSGPRTAASDGRSSDLGGFSHTERTCPARFEQVYEMVLQV